ncbi:MAG: hypothetical protein R3C68_15875 [Myxococcota bacterium]
MFSFSVHANSWRLAIVLEIDGAPDIDPESILEAHLASDDDGRLSSTQRFPAWKGFARCGGQNIRARPVDSKWRFGLTLPTISAPNQSVKRVDWPPGKPR